MKIPVNRHHREPGNRKFKFYVPNQNSGEGRGSLRPGDLGGGVDHPPDQTGGKSASSSLGG